MISLNHALNRYWIPKRAEGNFGIFSYLESNTKILYNIEKSEQFAGFSVYTNNEAARQIQIRTAQIFHLLLAVISNRQNRRKALKLLDLLRNQNHPKLSSFIRCYP